MTVADDGVDLIGRTFEVGSRLLTVYARYPKAGLHEGVMLCSMAPEGWQTEETWLTLEVAYIRTYIND